MFGQLHKGSDLGHYRPRRGGKKSIPITIRWESCHYGCELEPFLSLASYLAAVDPQEMNPCPLSPVCTRGLKQLDHSENRTLQTSLIHQFFRNLPNHLFCLCLNRFYSQIQQMFAKHPLCARHCFTITTLSLTEPQVLLDKLSFSPLSHTVSVGLVCDRNEFLRHYNQKIKFQCIQHGLQFLRSVFYLLENIYCVSTL